uniref:Uncharacterized protein n=1 Tax=Meloidogyne hapla TaxID=6305 RepID=A0A1I8B514_MELHA
MAKFFLILVVFTFVLIQACYCSPTSKKADSVRDKPKGILKFIENNLLKEQSIVDMEPVETVDNLNMDRLNLNGSRSGVNDNFTFPALTPAHLPNANIEEMNIDDSSSMVDDNFSFLVPTADSLNMDGLNINYKNKQN